MLESREVALRPREGGADPTAKIALAQAFVDPSRADNTKEAYGSDWKNFVTWCQTHTLESLPASEQTVAAYLGDLAQTHSPATLSRRLSTINRAHQQAGFRSPARLRENPLVADVMSEIRKTKGIAQKGARPVLLKDLLKMLDGLRDPIKAARDKTLLLIGFAGGLRSSELAAIKVSDIEWVSTGLIIGIPRSERDQEGRGEEVEIPYGQNPATCPLRALDNWMKIAPIKEGPVFRKVMKSGRIAGEALHPESITWILRRALEAAGFKGAKLKEFSSHSLRAGFCTQASLNGASEIEIMQQSRHKSMNTLRRYIRAGKEMKLRAAGKLGL
jgi:integrase